jgi:hypothetical protein
MFKSCVGILGRNGELEGISKAFVNRGHIGPSWTVRHFWVKLQESIYARVWPHWAAMFWMRSLHPPVSASMNRDHRKGQVCHDPVSYKMISTFYHCTHDISPTLTLELALHCVLTWCLRPDFYGSVYNWVESIVPVTYPFLLNPKSSHTLSCCFLLYSICFLYFCSSFLIPTRCYHVIIIERFFCYYELSMCTYCGFLVYNEDFEPI